MPHPVRNLRKKTVLPFLNSKSEVSSKCQHNGSPIWPLYWFLKRSLNLINLPQRLGFDWKIYFIKKFSLSVWIFWKSKHFLINKNLAGKILLEMFDNLLNPLGFKESAELNKNKYQKDIKWFTKTFADIFWVQKW